MAATTFRATIERSPSLTPRTPLRPLPAQGRPSTRLLRIASTVSTSAIWVIPTLVLAWPRADLLLVAFVAIMLAGAAALAAVVDEISIDRRDGADLSSQQVLSRLLLAAFLLGALDVGRLHWGDAVALRDARLAGIFVLGLGYILRTIVMGTNRFFSTVVVVQVERSHVVCDVGPYEYVRHPGYLSTIVILLAIPVAMGSLLAFVPALIAVGVVVRRTRLEDRFLHHNLAGYPAYAARVRWRLIPFVY